MMITSSFVAVLVLIIAVHVCAQEEEEDGVLPERFVRSFPNNYLASDLALRFGKRSWEMNGSSKRRIGINEKRRIDINDLALRFGKRSSYSFDPSNLNLRFGKRSFGGMLEGFDEKRTFVIPTDLALRFGKK
uniref:AFP-16 n=1 Tax=Ascaris suum TaxID=6253 RepID=A0A2L0E706_ASCSU|nr:AFP-16 [Ascaris suum]